MRTSSYLLSTLKETPADAEIISHQLMLRAGMIRRVASGLYTWTPTGLKVLRKVEQIVREEMQATGALEILMPMVQPADLWEESGRWDDYGPELLRLKDRHQRDFVLGPTHEEVISALVRNEVSSYKQLPLNLFQIQTKFRDEIRPRFGVMRAREFIMKDAYSFHTAESCLEKTYQKMYDAYSRIFTRLGLKFRAVLADTGSIGGSLSHEFHVLADTGEDKIAFSTESDYAANIELAEAVALDFNSSADEQELSKQATPNVKTIDDLVQGFDLPIEQTIKTLVVRGQGEDGEPTLVALIVRGDHQLNEIKATKIEGVLDPLEFATDEEIFAAVGAHPGSLGPAQLNLKIVVDRSVANLKNFSAGANEDGYHYFNLNWGRDAQYHEVADMRDVVEGDPSPCGRGQLKMTRGIEVGHIFQLGTTYSKALKVGVLNEAGKHQILTMGCYGIGVSRIVAAAIEQNYDGQGILWPHTIAPFEVCILPMNMHKSVRVQKTAEKLYRELSEAGFDVLFDDRKERPGVMFADMELIGIPHTLVVGERNLDEGMIEHASRANKEKQKIPVDNCVEHLKALLNS